MIGSNVNMIGSNMSMTGPNMNRSLQTRSRAAFVEAVGGAAPPEQAAKATGFPTIRTLPKTKCEGGGAGEQVGTRCLDVGLRKPE